MSSRMEAGNDRGETGPCGVGLSFFDHKCQYYAEVVRSPYVGEVLIGDYLDEGGIGPLGEFRIVLHSLGDGRGRLHPQLRVFGDGTAALALLIAVLGPDLSGLLGPVADQEEMSRRLIGLGLRDRSDAALTDAGRDG
jgi:hypothetical protein